MATKAQQTYERVEALMAEGKERPDAFRQVAEDNGQTVDSVRGAYYAGRRQTTGESATPRGGRSRRRTETTADDAIKAAIAGLENSITVIEREVKEADERAQEAAREAAALKDAAGPKIESIRAKIAALEGDS